MSQAVAEPKDAQFPRPLPEEHGFYWALMVWEFALQGEYRTLIFYTQVQGEPILIANEFKGEPWQHTRNVIPHDILYWGPKLEFPPLELSEL